MSDKKPAEVFTLPEGRLINASLFERDIFKNEQGKEGKPSYKIELAFPKSGTGLVGEGTDKNPTVEDRLLRAALDKWGDTDAMFNAFVDRKGVTVPFLDGDALAEKRRMKGKEGKAYEGMWVIRANTSFNKHGAEGPGGIAVYDEQAQAVDVARGQSIIWPGCYGIAAVTIGTYLDNRGDKGLKFYLVAFQRTRGEDSDRLVSARDTSKLFTPRGGAAAATGASTRRRA